jgi:hypothetical protein
MNGYRIGAITEHYQAIIADLPATPVVIGHCVGGLIAPHSPAKVDTHLAERGPLPADLRR